MDGLERLRLAIDSEPVPRDLSALVRTSLDTGRAPNRGWHLMPVLVALFGCVGLVFAVSEAYLVSMLRLGLSDHVHCALQNNYPKQSTEAEMAAAVGLEFAPILQPLQQKIGSMQLISAHQCSAAGRQYVHFVLRGVDGLTSISLLKRESLDWLPFSSAKKIDGISVFGYQDDDYLVFISSANPKEELAANLPGILAFHL